NKMQLFLILCAFLVLLQVGASPNPSKRSIAPRAPGAGADQEPRDDAGETHDSQAKGSGGAHPQPENPCKGKPNCVLLQVSASPNPSKRSIVPHTSANSASPDPKGEDAGAKQDNQAKANSAKAKPKPDDPCKGRPNFLLQVGAAPNPSKRSIVPHTSANSASPDPKGEDAGGQHDSQAGGRASAHPQPDDPFLLQVGATPNPSKRSIAPRTSSGAASRDPKAASAGAASPIGFLPLHPPAGSRHLI
ncbi:hypothetical protein PSTT_16508, partial [Puccinia striiformis]